MDKQQIKSLVRGRTALPNALHQLRRAQTTVDSTTRSLAREEAKRKGVEKNPNALVNLEGRIEKLRARRQRAVETISRLSQFAKDRAQAEIEENQRLIKSLN